MGVPEYSPVAVFNVIPGGRDPAVTLHRFFKFRNREELARPLGRRVARATEAAKVTGDLIVPVPPDPKRRRRPDPTRLLAREVARTLDIPLLPRALRKTRATARQTECPYDERRNGLRDAFRARKPGDIAGRRVLLVDDVATTLATIESAAGTLRAAGARSITAVVFARTPRSKESARSSSAGAWRR